MKGLPICATACGRIVTVWFSSPTGDSSDSHQFAIVCNNDEQASNLVDAYGEMIYNSVIVDDLIVKNKSLTETLNRHYGATV